MLSWPGSDTMLPSDDSICQQSVVYTWSAGALLMYSAHRLCSVIFILIYFLVLVSFSFAVFFVLVLVWPVIC